MLCPVRLEQFPLGHGQSCFPASTRVERVKLPSGQEIRNPLDL